MKNLKRPLNPKIEYYELEMTCTFGGCLFKSDSKDLRDKG